MKIFVKNQLWKIGAILQAMDKKVLRSAARRSVTRAASAVRTRAAKDLKKIYNLPLSGDSAGSGGLKPPGTKSMLIIEKSRGNTLDDIYAIVRASDKPISLIHFVRGNKTGDSQRGVPIKARKKVKVMILRGNTRPVQGGFIANTGNSYNVFRRQGKISLPIRKLAAPSMWKALERPSLKVPIQEFGQERFQQEMAHNIQFYLGQLTTPNTKS